MVEYVHTPVSVSGKRGVVMGGTDGPGRAIALGFASEGADVLAISPTDSLEETAAATEATGVDTAGVTGDLTDQDALEAVREAAVDAFGGIDVVASGGAISREALFDISGDEGDFVTDVALDAVRRVTRAMDEDAIVNTSSLTARLAMANLPAYTAAKGGVEALTRAAATELAPDIRANAIAPGFVITPQNEETYAEGTEKRAAIDERTPLGRVAEREEIVGAAVYLASDAASFVTGEVVTVDGGFADSAF